MYKLQSFQDHINESYRDNFSAFDKAIEKEGFKNAAGPWPPQYTEISRRFTKMLDRGLLTLEISSQFDNKGETDLDKFGWTVYFTPYIKIEKKMFGLIKKQLGAKSVDLVLNQFDFGYGMFAVDDTKVVKNLVRLLRTLEKRADKIKPEYAPMDKSQYRDPKFFLDKPIFNIREAYINEGLTNAQITELLLLKRKISGRYSKRFDVTKSEQFITIDVGDFDINIVSDASNDMVFVEMDSDNPKKSKEYGMRDYNKIFKVIDSWIKKHVNESVNEILSTTQAAKNYASDWRLQRMKPMDAFKSFIDYIDKQILSKFPKDKQILDVKNKVADMLGHMKSGKMKHDIEDIQDIVSQIEESVNEGMLIGTEVFEDSAGIIELQKDMKVKDSKGKLIHLKKGARGRHKRIGWDSDFFVWQGQDIPMMYRGKEQFPEEDVEIII